MRCYVFIQTTKLHIFSIYGNFLLFIFYFLKDIRTEEQVFLKDIRTEEQVLSLNQRTCSSVLLSYPRKQSPCSSVLLSYPRKQSPCSSVLLSYPRKQSPCSSVLLSYPRKQSLLFFCSPVFKNHVLMSNYHAHFSYSN